LHFSSPASNWSAKTEKAGLAPAFILLSPVSGGLGLSCRDGPFAFQLLAQDREITVDRLKRRVEQIAQSWDRAHQHIRRRIRRHAPDDMGGRAHALRLNDDPRGRGKRQDIAYTMDQADDLVVPDSQPDDRLPDRDIHPVRQLFQPLQT
jgi:hypothetical protein